MEIFCGLVKRQYFCIRFSGVTPYEQRSSLKDWYRRGAAWRPCPSGRAQPCKEQEEKKAQEANARLLDLTAKGLQLQVYTIKNGKEVLIGDSNAEKGSDEYEAMSQILSGDYRAQKGTYYFKVSRDESVESDKEMPYALQVLQGTSYKHDYVMTEHVSEDTTNKKNSTVPTSSTDGTLSGANAMLIQASRYEATAQMLAVGYQNMASIYGNNSTMTVGSLTVSKLS